MYYSQENDGEKGTPKNLNEVYEHMVKLYTRQMKELLVNDKTIVVMRDSLRDLREHLESGITLDRSRVVFWITTWVRKDNVDAAEVYPVSSFSSLPLPYATQGIY